MSPDQPAKLAIRRFLEPPPQPPRQIGFKP